MKRLGMLLMACAIVLGMSQCKKEETPSVNNEKIHITFTASCGQDGAKTDFYPGSGFSWPSGVMEYVNVGGSSSGYLGQLSGDGTADNNHAKTRAFSGEITAPQNGETLYFFYLGKGDHAGATSINFADQTGNLTDVTNKHIAIGHCTYHEGDDSFGATLNMVMSIACFNTSAFVDGSNNPETVYLSGDDIYSSAAIDYRTGEITGITKNYICTGKASEACYVALIPDNDATNNLGSTQINFVSKSHAGSIYFDGIIAPREFYAHTVGEPGLEVEITSPGSGSDPGYEPHVFSVSSTKRVQFSKGNLQYNNGTWSFAENQYTYLGSWSNNGAIDWFGWGTWTGSNNPYNLSQTLADYTFNASDFQGSISGYTDYTWYTLSKDEWMYLLNTGVSFNQSYRSVTVNNEKKVPCGHAVVMGVKGIVILPDDWDGSVDLNFTYGKSNWANVYTEETTVKWSDMENAGVVFLPAAGNRKKDGSPQGIGTIGSYWSSTVKTANSAAFYLNFSVGTSSYVLNAGANSANYFGNSVRLVREVE